MERKTGAPRALQLTLATATISLLLVLGAARTQPAQASTGSPIADAAMTHLGTHGGQCWTFMRAVVAEGTGRQVGFDYRQGYFEAGAVEVSAEEATTGDIIQIASDANSAAWASYPGLHTAIVLENLGGGVFNAIDSNQNWDELVALRPGYDPYAAAARYGLDVHIYRIPGGSGGDAAIPVSATTASEWAAGDSATVATGGDCLNLRSEPGLSGARIRCIPGGSAVTALGATVAADGFIWLQVESAYGTGWVAAMYLARTSTVLAIPPPAEPAAEPAPAVAEPAPETPTQALAIAHVDNSPGCLRLRDAASLAGAIRACLAAGSPVTILDATGMAAGGYTWLNVESPAGYQGWVASEFLIR